MDEIGVISILTGAAVGYNSTIFAILGIALVFFIWGRWRYDVVAFMALLMSVLVGVVPYDKAFDGLGHPATVPGQLRAPRRTLVFRTPQAPAVVRTRARPESPETRARKLAAAAHRPRHPPGS